MKKLKMLGLCSLCLLGLLTSCSQEENTTPPEVSQEVSGDDVENDTLQVEQPKEEIPQAEEEDSALETEEPVEEYTNPEEITGYFEVVDGILVGFEGDIASIVIPDHVNTIGEGAFLEMRHLESVTIPESVVKIDVGAFDSCISLWKIKIPATVLECDADSFRNCPNVRLSVSSEASYLEALKAADLVESQY